MDSPRRRPSYFGDPHVMVYWREYNNKVTYSCWHDVSWQESLDAQKILLGLFGNAKRPKMAANEVTEFERAICWSVDCVTVINCRKCTIRKHYSTSPKPCCYYLCCCCRIVRNKAAEKAKHAHNQQQQQQQEQEISSAQGSVVSVSVNLKS